MFFFYLDDRQFINCFLTCLVFLPLSLGLLLRQPSYHFENIVVRIETLLKVTHEIIRGSSIHRLLHSQELMCAEQVMELYDGIRYSVNLLVDLLLFLGSWLLSAHSTLVALIWPEALSILLYCQLDSSLIIWLIIVTTILIVVLLSVGRLITLISDYVNYELWSSKSHASHVDIVKSCGAGLPLSVS